jgi:hypothetical protein
VGLVLVVDPLVLEVMLLVIKVKVVKVNLKLYLVLLVLVIFKFLVMVINLVQEEQVLVVKLLHNQNNHKVDIFQDNLLVLLEQVLLYQVVNKLYQHQVLNQLELQE